MKEMKPIIYMGLTLGMLFYAVPRLDIQGDSKLATFFGIIWIAFALVIVAAHLHELLGVEEETKRQVAKVKRMKRWQLEKAIQGKGKMLQFKK
ncbi:hypothetical protein [Paenibacillus rigui]|uniref:Uncharacterized protein n=1 Tax=Paenibacillus rigui TaxID=554312 RepID=A0A229ULT4_9BACL|nr:hypothetical protein [Paenibacillus rigui]OXM84264.1 hypothetical protein CF651_20990 [Paenibacillus rigui]